MSGKRKKESRRTHRTPEMIERRAEAGEAQMFAGLHAAELLDWHRRVNDVVFYARAAARSKGYALATHGTLRRDVG